MGSLTREYNFYNDQHILLTSLTLMLHFYFVKDVCMRCIIIILTIAISCFTPAMAQDDGTSLHISGTIADEEKNPIPFASVALYNQSDTSLVNGAVSDDAGKFEITTEPGTYFLKISFLSFEEKIIPSIIANDRDIEVGTIVLKQAAKLLEEVVVTGEKSQMELQLDKRVFNVSKDLSNIGGNAADILNN